jgi:hypothetical protein
MALPEGAGVLAELNERTAGFLTRMAARTPTLYPQMPEIRLTPEAARAAMEKTRTAVGRWRRYHNQAAVGLRRE